MPALIGYLCKYKQVYIYGFIAMFYGNAIFLSHNPNVLNQLIWGVRPAVSHRSLVSNTICMRWFIKWVETYLMISMLIRPHYGNVL